ncbi:hypothetical protein BG015_008069 [Linnemannia schmuckeri]|uniref:TLC domain-containing protein n=1 Tax=Linnemannia schmuckeri TaxID=64567 RepID=A0A9P5RXI4_9FUNG|nr:hypothetical protein BG015_008069 [Linnemannia schmuckeri]
MININELTSGPLSCPVSHKASSLFSSPASAYDTSKCAHYSLTNNIATHPTSSPSSSFLAPSPTSFSRTSYFFTHQEPLLFYSFDLNPNTSTFTFTFLTALVLQLIGFFLFKHYVPQVANPTKNRQNRRALSWVLSLFSSIILFTGTFTLSSEIEWNLPGGHPDNSAPFFLLTSMHKFPRESGLATGYCAYFVSYLICDLVLGCVYYRDFVDPLSGWAHHLFYLGVMSRATAQGNISTLFAMGAPIEVSTIFLATGHIFPRLRSDVVFATSFFLARIVYPIALLPELFLNVESRLCWKVATMALLVHVYWFHKFVQQQLRYYHARQQTAIGLSSTTATATTDAVKVVDEQPAVSPAAVTFLKTGEESLKKAEIICEYEVTVPVTKSADGSKAPESPTASNDTFGMELPQIQVNSSRHHRPRVVRLPSGQSIASLAAFESSIIDENDASPVALAVPTMTTSPPAIAITTSFTSTTAAAAVSTPAAPTMGAKTMKQLLEECSDEDISTYKFPIHSNKTLSALARKPLNDGRGSQGLSGGNDGLGVARLSRASSMRDSKRRIALGSVQFAASPSAAGERKAAKNEPISVKTEEGETEGNDEAVVAALKKKSSSNNVIEGDATVVIRPRRSSPSRDGDYGFGTIRVSRGGVVAVNA